MTTTPAPSGDPRWDRLSATFADAGLQVRVDRRTFPGGVSYSARLWAGTYRVVIQDCWWKRNLDTWTGWQVYVEGPDSLVKRTYAKTKKRGQVLRDVQDALSKHH